MQKRIALFSDSNGWHETRLKRAFAARETETVLLSLKDCAIGSGPAGCFSLDLPGFNNALPDAVFVRNIPGGSFEQVTLRLDILHALQACGVLVYNCARVIERTVDKAMASFLLARAGLPTPPSWTCESAAKAQRFCRYETAAGRELVVKPLFGSRGQGLERLDAETELPDAGDYNGVYYQQRFVAGGTADSIGRDWRVMVIGGRAVAAMERRAGHWITNRARGGICRPAALDEPLSGLAEAAAAALGAAYAGVDIIKNQNDGEYLVLELNSIPAWRGLQSVSAVDIADCLSKDLLGRLPASAIEAAS